MSTKDTPWKLPDKTVGRADEADSEVRISDFALLSLLPVRSVAVAGFPLNELAIVALIGLCLFRPARGGARLPPTVVLTVGGLLAVLTYSGLANAGAANDADWTRRVGHVAIMAALIWAGGTGRLSLRSAGLGLATGFVATIALAMVKVGGDYYPGRLSGYLADPNAAAYFIAVVGVVAIFFCDDRVRVRVAVGIPLAAGLVLCYSRTGLLAGALMVVWMVLGRRLGQVAGTALALGMVWVVNNIPQSLTTFGPFSDRSGSDSLRQRIIAQEQVELANVPWYGHGPGTATVEIRDLTFFFHNSYLATRQEGGWAALGLLLALLAYCFVVVSRQSGQGDLKAAACQAAIIGTAAMAITLGEVLLDTPVSVVVAFAVGHALRAPSEDSPDG